MINFKDCFKTFVHLFNIDKKQKLLKFNQTY